MVEILDDTLREGEQTPNVAFSLEQKIAIVRALDNFGVDFISVGFPAISQKIFDDIKVISNLRLKTKILGHSRAKTEDIDQVLECGCEWIGIFMAINDISLRYKYKLTKDEAQEKFLFALDYAKRKGLKVRCSIEDGSRTPIYDWVSFAQEAEKIGVERISFIDTVGAMTPLKTYFYVNEIKKVINTDLHVHCHNDFGMAEANALAAFEAGVKCIDVTINGLGERAGIASLATITAALSELYGMKKWDLQLLNEICVMISDFTGMPIPVRQPIVGEDVFTHKAGLHSGAVLENPNLYEAIHPEDLGRRRKIVIGSYSGKKVYSKYLRNINPALSDDEILNEFNQIKKSRQNDVIWEI